MPVPRSSHLGAHWMVGRPGDEFRLGAPASLKRQFCFVDTPLARRPRRRGRAASRFAARLGPRNAPADCAANPERSAGWPRYSVDVEDSRGAGCVIDGEILLDRSPFTVRASRSTSRRNPPPLRQPGRPAMPNPAPPRPEVFLKRQGAVGWAPWNGRSLHMDQESPRRHAALSQKDSPATEPSSCRRHPGANTA
jgi:hypothetical protein